METVTKNIAEIAIAGKNVTADVSPMLSKTTYADKIEAESDDITMTFEDTSELWRKSWYPQEGDMLQVKLGTLGDMLDCGQFEIDEIGYEFPPDTVVVKGIAAAITKELRTKNSKAFEKQSLRKIAQYFADKHKLKLTGNVSALAKIEIERKTQERQTDLSFLAGIAREYGFVFSMRGGQLVFMDYDELDAQPSIMTVDKSEMSKANFTDKTSQVYGGAVVSTRDIKSNTVKSWSIKPSADGTSKDTLVVSGRAESAGQAQAKAKAALKAKNRDKITGTFTTEGKTKLVAGVNIDLTGIGGFSGKWQVVTSTHTVSTEGGYTTAVSVRKIVDK